MLATLVPTTDAFALWHRVQDFGGYTVDPDTGEVPTSGYVVSLPDYQRVYTRDTFRPADVVHGLVDARNARRLTPEHTVYAGAWHDTSSGLIFTDASVIFSDREQAARYARVWDQIAFYDIATGEDIRTDTALPAAA